MKVNFKSLAMLLMVACSCMVVFSSCSSDDNNDNGGNGTSGSTTKDVAYGFKCSTGLLTAADVLITYLDTNGNAQTHTMTLPDTVWFQKYTGVADSTTMSMTLTCTRKTGVSYDDSYRFAIGGRKNIYTKGAGSMTKESYDQSTSISTSNVAWQYIENWVSPRNLTISTKVGGTAIDLAY